MRRQRKKNQSEILNWFVIFVVEFQFTIRIGFEQHPHNKHMFSIDSVCDTKISGHGVNKKEFLRYITERGWGDGG